jgi:hypothetical protein
MARFSTRRVPSGIPGTAAFLAVLAAAVTCPGCKPLPPAVASNTIQAPGEEHQKKLLTDQDRAEALAAMAEATGPMPPPPPEGPERPAPAPYGVRWSDIPLALYETGFAEGVELAVYRTTVTPDRYEFELRTVEGWPGELVIVRVEGDEVYRIEQASIGRFPDEPACVERADALVKELRLQLERLGAQPWFND